MFRRFILAALLLLFCYPPLHAQSEWQQYTFASAIHSLAEEGDYLWLATDNGLVKFDKRTYTKEIFTRVNSGLPSVSLSAVVVDRNGVKWVATSRGLVRFDGTTWQTFDKATTSLSLSGSRTLFVDHNNTLWVSTWSELVQYTNDIWTSRLLLRGTFTSLETIYETQENNIMLGGVLSSSYPALLYELHPTTSFLTEQKVGNDQTGMNVWASVYLNGNLWLAGDYDKATSGNYATGKVVWSNGTNSRTFLNAEMGFPEHASFTSVSLDSAGNVWVGDAYGQGVTRFDGKTWKVFNHTNSPIKDSRVNAILTDRDGVVWIATGSNGLVRFDGTTWRTFATADIAVPDPAFPPLVTAIATDDKHNIHIGCENGYGIFDGKQMQWYGYTGSDFSVRSLAVDPQGTTWIVANTNNQTPGAPLARVDIGDQYAHCTFTDKSGTVWIGADNGVVACDQMIQTHFTPSNSGMMNQCTAIAEAPDGSLWFGTENGVVRYDGGTWTQYHKQDIPVLRTVKCTVMAVDRAGNLWIGNGRERGSALVKFDGNEWTGYNVLNGTFPLYTISSLAVDKNGILWVAALPSVSSNRPADREKGGLARFDGNVWSTWLYTDDGSPLPSPLLTSLVVDAHNDLWIGTGAGLLRHRSSGIAVSTGESLRQTSAGFFLSQNTPNPASAQTTITYELPSGASQYEVQLTVFNILGTPVATLVNSHQPPGSYSIEFNTETLPAGVYYYRLQTGSTTISKQMVVVR